MKENREYFKIQPWVEDQIEGIPLYRVLKPLNEVTCLKDPVKGGVSSK